MDKNFIEFPRKYSRLKLKFMNYISGVEYVDSIYSTTYGYESKNSESEYTEWPNDYKLSCTLN
jgi:hypothetical protein